MCVCVYVCVYTSVFCVCVHARDSNNNNNNNNKIQVRDQLDQNYFINLWHWLCVFYDTFIHGVAESKTCAFVYEFCLA